MTMNKRKLWFKIFLWAWLASIPLMIVAGIAADSLQHSLQPVPTDLSAAAMQAWQNTPTPPAVIAARLANVAVILYMMLGWIPVIVFGFLKEAKGKK